MKELEQLLQTLEAHKRIKLQKSDHDAAGFSTSIFSDFFTFPQYSTCSSFRNNINSRTESMAAKKRSAVADIEVTKAEGHANIKILSRRYPKQLFKMVTGFHSLGLHVLHLNVTTFDHEVLYTFSVKVSFDIFNFLLIKASIKHDQLINIFQIIYVFFDEIIDRRRLSAAFSESDCSCCI